jgi:hypothetical protein
LLVTALDSEEEKCEICVSDTFFKVFFATKDLDTVLASVHSIATMDIHLMFDNFGLKCTFNTSFCVEYVFDELG